MVANELGLALGQKITAVIRNDPYSVTVRGWSEKNYIITDVPKIQGEVVRVAPQTGCSVQFVREGVVVMFETFVEYIYSQAVSFMIIEYPRTFERIKLRKLDRHKANFKCSYTIMTGGMTTQGTGTIRDLSMGGCLFCHENPLIKDSKISFSFNLPDGPFQNVEAQVRNVRKIPKGVKEPYITGIKFINLNPQLTDLLTKFFETRSLDRRNGSRVKIAI